MGIVLYNKGYQIIVLYILLQLIHVLKPGSNLINFYEDQKEVGVRTSKIHIYKVLFVMFLFEFHLKTEEKHIESLYYLININTERK